MIRFGIIGCGNIAKNAFLPALRQCPDAKLAAVASRSKTKAEAITSEFGGTALEGYNLLLAREDIDAVYIALPVGLHAEWAIAAAENAKHVLCEKSLAINVQETRNILEACQRNGVALFEGFSYQFHTQHQLARQIIDSGKIGAPILFQAWFGFPPINSPHRNSKVLGGGALLDAGAYTVHSACSFFNSPPTTVSGVLENQDKEIDIHGSALLNFGNSKTATLAFGFNNMYRNSYSIWGTEGQLTLLRAFSLPPNFSPTMTIENQNIREERSLEPFDQFREEIEYFCRNLNNRDMQIFWRKNALQQANTLELIRVANSQN